MHVDDVHALEHVNDGLSDFQAHVRGVLELEHTRLQNTKRRL